MKHTCSLLILLMLCTFLAKSQPSDSYIQSIMNAGHIPGANAVIIKDGHWMYQRNWGKADLVNNKDITRETIFMMASISKSVIATALMQLWEKGAFKLDDNINNYLPFQLKHPKYPNDSITFRMLATHTAAIKDNYTVTDPLYVYGDSPIPLDTFMRNYLVDGGTYYNAAGNFYTYRPGSASNYSNIGATLAAYLVQRITGDDFSHYCDTAIFSKLCMNNTSFKLAGIYDTNLIARPYVWYNGKYEDAGLYGYPDYPDGQLRTNITALARFMTMYMQYGTFNNVKILDSATVAYMMQQQTPVKSTQGIIFYSVTASNGDILWGHEGGDYGTSTAMYFSYAQKTGAIVFTNGIKDPVNNMNEILDTLYKYGLTLTPSSADTFTSCRSTTGIAIAGSANHMDAQLYPNPATQATTLTYNTQENSTIAIVITDITGKLTRQIYNGPSSKGSHKVNIDLEGFNTGIYFVSIISNTGRQNIKLSVLK